MFSQHSHQPQTLHRLIQNTCNQKFPSHRMTRIVWLGLTCLVLLTCITAHPLKKQRMKKASGLQNHQNISQSDPRKNMIEQLPIEKYSSQKPTGSGKSTEKDFGQLKQAEVNKRSAGADTKISDSLKVTTAVPDTVEPKTDDSIKIEPSQSVQVGNSDKGTLTTTVTMIEVTTADAGISPVTESSVIATSATNEMTDNREAPGDGKVKVDDTVTTDTKLDGVTSTTPVLTEQTTQPTKAETHAKGIISKADDKSSGLSSKEPPTTATTPAEVTSVDKSADVTTEVTTGHQETEGERPVTKPGSDIQNHNMSRDDPRRNMIEEIHIKKHSSKTEATTIAPSQRPTTAGAPAGNLQTSTETDVITTGTMQVTTTPTAVTEAPTTLAQEEETTVGANIAAGAGIETTTAKEQQTTAVEQVTTADMLLETTVQPLESTAAVKVMDTTVQAGADSILQTTVTAAVESSSQTTVIDADTTTAKPTDYQLTTAEGPDTTAVEKSFETTEQSTLAVTRRSNVPNLKLKDNNDTYETTAAPGLEDRDSTTALGVAASTPALTGSNTTEKPSNPSVINTGSDVLLSNYSESETDKQNVSSTGVDSNSGLSVQNQTVNVSSQPSAVTPVVLTKETHGNHTDAESPTPPRSESESESTTVAPATNETGVTASLMGTAVANKTDGSESEINAVVPALNKTDESEIEITTVAPNANETDGSESKITTIVQGVNKTRGSKVENATVAPGANETSGSENEITTVVPDVNVTGKSTTATKAKTEVVLIEGSVTNETDTNETKKDTGVKVLAANATATIASNSSTQTGLLQSSANTTDTDPETVLSGVAANTTTGDTTTPQTDTEVILVASQNHTNTNASESDETAIPTVAPGREFSSGANGTADANKTAVLLVPSGGNLLNQTTDHSNVTSISDKEDQNVTLKAPSVVLTLNQTQHVKTSMRNGTSTQAPSSDAMQNQSAVSTAVPQNKTTGNASHAVNEHIEIVGAEPKDNDTVTPLSNTTGTQKMQSNDSKVIPLVKEPTIKENISEAASHGQSSTTFLPTTDNQTANESAISVIIRDGSDHPVTMATDVLHVVTDTEEGSSKNSTVRPQVQSAEPVPYATTEATVTTTSESATAAPPANETNKVKVEANLHMDSKKEDKEQSKEFTQKSPNMITVKSTPVSNDSLAVITVKTTPAANASLAVLPKPRSTPSSSSLRRIKPKPDNPDIELPDGPKNVTAMGSTGLSKGDVTGIAIACIMAFWLITIPLVCLVCKMKDRRQAHREEKKQDSLNYALIPIEEMYKADMAHGKERAYKTDVGDHSETEKLTTSGEPPSGHSKDFLV